MPDQKEEQVGQVKTETAGKPCVCHIKTSGWPWKATGKTEGEQREERCRICGATHLVSA